MISVSPVVYWLGLFMDSFVGPLALYKKEVYNEFKNTHSIHNNKYTEVIIKLNAFIMKMSK